MKRLWTLSCIMVLVLASLASAQVSFNFSGGGARAEGMGRAFYGISDDANAVGWNPAGLIALERPILGLTYTTLRPRGYFESNKRFDQLGSFNNLTSASFQAPVRIRGHQFVLAAAYTQTSEDYSYFQVDSTDSNVANPDLPSTSFSMDWQSRHSEHYNPYMINFGFGTPVLKNLSIGLAANIYTGRAVVSGRDDMFGYDYRPASKEYQAVTADYSFSQLDTAKYSGVNFTIGFKYVMPRFTTGLVVKTGYSLSYLDDQKFSDTVRYNGQVQSNFTLYQDDQLTKVEIPWVIGGGVGYKLTDNWLLAFDAEYRPYSGKVVKRRTSFNIGSGGNKEETFTTVDPGWYNVFTVRAGTEYLKKFSNRFVPLVPLRAGLGYIPVPTPDLAIDGSTTSTKMYTISAGTGVYWSQIHLDLSYVLSIHNRNLDVTKGFVTTSTTGGTQVVRTFHWTGEQQNRTHRLNLSFTGYF